MFKNLELGSCNENEISLKFFPYSDITPAKTKDELKLVADIIEYENSVNERILVGILVLDNYAEVCTGGISLYSFSIDDGFDIHDLTCSRRSIDHLTKKNTLEFLTGLKIAKVEHITLSFYSNYMLIFPVRRLRFLDHVYWNSLTRLTTNQIFGIEIRNLIPILIYLLKCIF